MATGSLKDRIAMFNTKKDEAPPETSLRKVKKRRSGTGKVNAWAKQLEQKDNSTSNGTSDRPPKKKKNFGGRAAMFEAKIQAAKNNENPPPSKGPRKKVGKVSALAQNLNIRVGPQMKGPPIIRKRGVSEATGLSQLKFEKPTISAKRHSRVHRDAYEISAADSNGILLEEKEMEESAGKATSPQTQTTDATETKVVEVDDETSRQIRANIESNFETEECMVMHPSLIVAFLNSKFGMNLNDDSVHHEEITKICCDIFGAEVSVRWGLALRCVEDFRTSSW